ncbi:hypothetical protein, partial [Enterococcus faecium]|uniref:hypothetical protein n=1 Tax=Enterococcus faecium TaxID=1352 RepID=UPI0034E932D1
GREPRDPVAEAVGRIPRPDDEPWTHHRGAVSARGADRGLGCRLLASVVAVLPGSAGGASGALSSAPTTSSVA